MPQEGNTVRKTLKLISILILGLAAGVLWGCGHETHQGQDQTATGTDVGQVLPGFTLEEVDGGQLSLADLRGRAVLLDFWDTWCPPCRKALPHLQELSQEHQDGLQVVGIALGQEGQAKVKSFIAARGFTFPFVYGNVEVFQKFGIQSLPTTMLLDKDGVIVKKWIGGYPKGAYEEEIVKLLGE